MELDFESMFAPSDGGSLGGWGAPQPNAFDPDDRDLIVRTVIGEAHGQPIEGQAGVAHVILNRVKSGQFGGGVKDVLFAPKQFEPWETRAKGLMAIPPDSPVYQQTAQLVDGVLGGELPDPTQGATHFLNQTIVKRRRGGSLPRWARGPGQQIGQHTFYAPNGPVQMQAGMMGGPQGDTLVGGSDAPDFDSMFAPAQPPAPEPAMPQQVAPTQAETPQEAASGFDPMNFMTGYTRSIIGQGMGMGVGDEAEAGIRAGGTSLLGDPRDVGAIYDENLTNIRGEMQQFGEEYPVISTGAEIVGAIAPAVLSRGRTAPTSIMGATGRAMGTGAAYGGAYGFGTGEGTEDRINQAGLGAAIGGGVGALATPLAAGTMWAGQQIARPLLNTMRSAINPEKEAARRIADAIGIDQRASGSGLSAAQSALARNVTGQPTINMDVGDEVTRRVARSAANESPEAGAILHKTIDDRFEGQGERIISWLRAKTGFSGDASATLEAAEQASRAANKPAYLALYKAGNWNVSSPELTRLMEAPEVQQALKFATEQGKSVAIADKMPWQPSDRTTIQIWDYAQRRLSSMSDMTARTGDKAQARVLSSLRRQLNSELDKLVPEFNTARTGAAKFFGAEDALDAGGKFANLSASIGEARRAHARFSPDEKQMFSEGFVSSIMDTVNKTKDRANVVQRIWGSAKSREQIQMVLGPQKAKEFEAFMAIETVMDKSRGALGGSTTARQWMDMGLAASQGAPAGILAGYGTGDPMTGIVTALTWRAGRRIAGKSMQAVNDSVAKHIATKLTSNDPTTYRQGVQMIAKSQRLMGQLRLFIGSMAGVTAGQQGVSGE